MIKNGLKTRIGVLGVVILLAIGGVIAYRYFHVKQQLSVSQQPIFFYGTECPHCHVVNDFIRRQNIQKRYPMVVKEVFHDNANAYDYIRVAKHCGILQTVTRNKRASYQIFVPMLWTGKKCINGDIPIIQYLQRQRHLTKKP